MPPASNEEQFKFLISCIRYSNNGKVDFGQVALECKIVSKGAAAKRYERMMRAHGIAPNAATIKPGPSRAIKTDRSDSIDKPNKKRKTDAYIEDNGATDDEEPFAPNVKLDPTVPKEEDFKVKEEDHSHSQGQQLSLYDASHLINFYDPPSPYYGSLGGGQNYAGVESGVPTECSSSAGYPTQMIGGYGMPAQPYDFGNGYEAIDMSCISRPVDSGLHYQSMMQFPTDPQGRSDSPVIVE